MNIKQTIKNHPRRVGGCCLAVMGVTLILVIITLSSSGSSEGYKNRILYHLNTDLLTDPQTEADKIMAAWSYDSHRPSVAELKTAAQLAQEGYLSSVRCMRVRNMNISEI